jgi:type IV pilus assembly protein PilB
MALPRLQVRFLEVLVEFGRIKREDADAISKGDKTYEYAEFEKLLVEQFSIGAYSLLVARARVSDIGVINVSRIKMTEDAFRDLGEDFPDFCKQNACLPIGVVGDYLLLAFANPFEQGLIDRAREAAGVRITPMLGKASDIATKLKGGNGNERAGFDGVIDQVAGEYSEGPEKAAEEISEESAPIIQLATRIIEEGYFDGASDIHIEPMEKDLVIRYRVDGNLKEVLRLPRKTGPALIARLKIMCNLDISERRLPQDGRIIFKQYTKKGLDVDLRVSTAPLNHGEGAVMRILDKQKSTLPLPALGFSEENLARYRECIRQPYGMILHCGPTGSGKSMTLYSALGEINTPDICIRTAEDPIEYTLNGINQMQMSRPIGLTFATALRSFLRQDPDIILVGEIRDKETAGIAIEAALTGHLLISTLHTNDAPSTVARLTDMGIEPFMISSSLVCVCAQRLLRRVCKKCKVPYELEGRPKEIMYKAIGWSGTVYKANPKGCPTCGGGGYKGRCGIHELMTASSELIEAINKEAETAELKRICQKNGMKTLHQDSMLKVKEGITTMDEAVTSVPPDME